MGPAEVGASTNTIRINEVGLSELYPLYVQRNPAMWWDSYGALGIGVETAVMLDYVTNIAHYGRSFAPWAFEVDEGWTRILDSNGILRDDTNYCNVRLISDAVHSFGMKFWLYSTICG